MLRSWRGRSTIRVSLLEMLEGCRWLSYVVIEHRGRVSLLGRLRSRVVQVIRHLLWRRCVSFISSSTRSFRRYDGVDGVMWVVDSRGLGSSIIEPLLQMRVLDVVMIGILLSGVIELRSRIIGVSVWTGSILMIGVIHVAIVGALDVHG